ncbi:uncharacterized protein BJ171DRAFT_268970 [Polychytrium aggregatum]|uniref:uncharacterized protein n=1 Tax=Polychytrium aggregatum TaxID=110093 RepID=UPI0022FE9584|nr:uncharacterized protein BJ171DRAFT_268970 [Polychytrium aggregatum]KAI9193378.1 hypothetical protein BJ171DRAFT_268970 [Polychytrium aggregatum]
MADTWATRESETLWDEDAQRAIQLQKELSRLTDDLAEHDSFAQKFVECLELKELALQESDWTLMDEVLADLANLHTSMESYSLRLLMADPADKNGCFVELRAGSGGTESCDWVAMITRMYTRWAQSAGYTAKVVDEMKGDIAGFKNTTISIAGENAYGWCKYEGGVHRFVRISPFGDGNKRHTSFISVQVFPAHQSAEDGSTGSIDIPPGDIKIETMRSQGAGGQHVNTTDSAVRLTHIPTGIIINCQNERSQHQNRAMAIEMLKAKLYQRKLAEEASARAELRDALPENGWGSQIRTYVLQPYQMVKDLRSGYEQSNVQGVLDGDIDGFLRASLIHFKRKR